MDLQYMGRLHIVSFRRERFGGTSKAYMNDKKGWWKFAKPWPEGGGASPNPPITMT